MPKRSPIRPEDIYEIANPAATRLSPSGDRLIATLSRADRKSLKYFSHLWICRFGADGRSDTIRQFTRGKHADRTPRWSPDGRSIAFLSNRREKSELWIIPSDGGEARPLTELDGNIHDFAWSPDGRQIAFTFTAQDAEAKELAEKKKRGDPGADAPRVRRVSRLQYKYDGAGFLPQNRPHLWSLNVSSGRVKQLVDDDRYEEGSAGFSPDGQWIYFVSNRSEDPDRHFRRWHIWRTPASGGAIRRVPTFDGPSTNFSLSPDGKSVAFLGSPDPDVSWHRHHQRLWVAPASGGKPVCLTRSLDRQVGNSTINDTSGTPGAGAPIWSPDSRTLYFVVTNAGNSEIWRVDTRDRRPEPVVNEPGMVIDFDVDFARGWIHAAWNDLGNPGEIVSFPLPPVEAAAGRRTQRSRPIGTPAVARPVAVRPVVRTRWNSSWLEGREVALPEEFWYQGKGRHRLQGWILRPPRPGRAAKRPGILYIHGGPATQYGRSFFHEFQVLAAHGYAVFYTNPRGGTGYSEAHMNVILSRWGTIDYEDLMTFTDEVLARSRDIDAGRLAVAGGSYGGFMTNWIIGHTDRFACAVSSRSISNFMSFIGSSDFGFAWPIEFGGAGPWTNPGRYLRMSPLNYLRKMKTPTLIEHQEQDHRCPIEQAEQLWTALKSKGVPVGFLRYPGESHGMSRGGRPDRRIDRLERILAWLGRWTKPARSRR